MHHFTPVSAVLGGALIGLSTVILWLANGRIAGISGVLGSLLAPRAGDTAWRLAFLAGIVAAPLAYALIHGAPETSVSAGPFTLILAGLLTGFGTRLGSGCTSGHGVCGLARLSRRSMVATGLFMLSAAATVFVMRHVVGG